MEKKRLHVVVLTGAGISAESGIETFRASDGLWANHRVEDVATPQGFKKNPTLVYEFYNQRRKQLFTVEPNEGHKALAELEKTHQVTIITQNVDDLHERAGSSYIIHLHGELLKARSLKDPEKVTRWEGDMNGQDGVRPHIVWFGEAVPMIEFAAEEVEKADIVIVIGTSMKVYPAAGLVGLAQPHVPIYYVDPFPNLNYELERANNLEVIEKTATIGVPELVKKLQG